MSSVWYGDKLREKREKNMSNMHQSFYVRKYRAYTHKIINVIIIIVVCLF